MILFFKKIVKFIFYVSIALIAIGLVISLFFPITYKELIHKYSLENDLDPFLVASIINVESKYNKDAISQKDARGLMQIGEQTGKWGAEVLGINEYNNQLLFDPEINIRIGTWYVNQLKSEFNGDMNLVLAAYNAGSGNVSKWLEDEKYSKDGETLETIPFEETDEYLDKINLNYKVYRLIYKSYMEKPETILNLYFDVIIYLRTFIKRFV